MAKCDEFKKLNEDQTYLRVATVCSTNSVTPQEDNSCVILLIIANYEQDNKISVNLKIYKNISMLFIVFLTECFKKCLHFCESYFMIS